MPTQIDKFRQYAALVSEIREMEFALGAKEAEYNRQYASEFSSIKQELGNYIARIRPTVETVCTIYRSKISLDGSWIRLQGLVPVAEYEPCNACALALRYGNEAIGALSAVIQKHNVDAALREFAYRYNAVVDIYTKADNLQLQAVSRSVDAYRDQIAQRYAMLQTIGENDLQQLYARSEQLIHRSILQDRLEMETEFVTEISLPVAYEPFVCPDLGISQETGAIISLLQWPLREEGILHIRTSRDNMDHLDLSACTVNTLIQFLFSYIPGGKKILLCDSCASNYITTFAGIAQNADPELFFDRNDGCFVKSSEDEIRSSLNELSKLIHQRIMLLAQSGCENVLSYNRDNQNNPLPLILAFLNGYPGRYAHSEGALENILKNGKNAGVYFLVVEYTDRDEEDRYCGQHLPRLDAFTGNSVDFTLVEGKGYLCRGKERYVANTCGNDYRPGAILSALKADAIREGGKVVELDSVVERENFSSSPRREKYSKTLSIPFGKQGANPVTVELGADGPDAHLAVIGTTGSGKTAFINSLVLSACKLYSPTELELHLIVMVKKDFAVFEEQGLPHLKTVVTGDRIFAANDVLDFIDSEMKRRGNLIGSYGNIYAYNAVARQPLPRCMIIIDEFYQLVQGSDDAIERINRIAQMGRAYGISLVVSSIRFPMEVNSLIPLLGNRIEFKSGENAGQLIPQAAIRQNELDGAKGSCFYAHESAVQTVRVAYSGEGEELNRHIRDIKAKFPDYAMELQSRICPMRISCEMDAPFTAKRVQAQYDEEGVLRARLGRVYLSNEPLEYPFDSRNNLLFLFGPYTDTKTVEAGLIKDTLVLSRNVEEPAVFYIDYNRNASLRRTKTMIKALRDSWVLSGKMVFATGDQAEDTFDDLRQIMMTRETDDECSLHPILVVIAKADELFADDDLCETLCELINRGKENNVYFAIQCSEPVRFYGSDKYLNDAILFPDRYSQGDDHSSAQLCAALEAMPAGATDRGRKLIANASVSPLDPQLHILCNNSKMTIFVPYEYDEEYLRNITD